MFIGCEGESEASYAALLARLADEEPRLYIHIDPHILQPGAGDPLEIVRQAIKTIRLIERRRSPYAIRAILLDRGTADKGRQAISLAARAGILLVWQEPDHEAFLLRHLQGWETRRPPSGTSLRILLQAWTEYRKPMTTMDLAKRINRRGLRAVAQVEPLLAELLRSLGFGDEK